ncbi:MAG: hypothetical protein OSJ66_03535 [Clostridia bacterium]|nr:hypothetical protein [Clostridia bacterium]
MYQIKRNVDINSMKCLGIITANERNLYRDVQSYIFRKGITPTEFFYKKLEGISYGADNNPVLSMINGENLIVAKKDEDAIFIYSEDKILSPTQLTNLFVHLYDATRNADRELGQAIYANFGLNDLKINFINMNMLTGITPEVMEQACPDLKIINGSKVFFEGEQNKVKTLYDGNTGKLEYTHTSQNGINLMSFIDTIINLNPDIRLLMSNTSVTPSRETLVNILLSTIRKNYSGYRNYSDMEIARDLHAVLGADKEFDEKDKSEFFEAFNREKKSMLYRIESSNKTYKVFPALRYVLEKQHSKENEGEEDLDTKYMLRWYEGDPDNGARAINFALGVMSEAISSEREPNMNACRNMQEVKIYMKDIKERTTKLNEELKKRQAEKGERKHDK